MRALDISSPFDEPMDVAHTFDLGGCQMACDAQLPDHLMAPAGHKGLHGIEDFAELVHLHTPRELRWKPVMRIGVGFIGAASP